MTGTLPLSSLIATLDRAGLEGLVASRRIAAPASVKDSLDLAAELLKPESIGQALTLVHRDDLRVLASAGAPRDAAARADTGAESRARLRALGLLGNHDTELPEVTLALSALLAEHGLGTADLGPTLPAPTAHAAPPADTASWFAGALTTTAQAAWVLRDIQRAPAKLNRNGEVASVWLRGAEERLAVPDLEALIELLRAARLLEPVETWCVSRGTQWLRLEQAERWIELALAAVTLMPREFLGLIAGAEPGSPVRPAVEGFTTSYPLATAPTIERIERGARLWERLGITVHGNLSLAGASALPHSRLRAATLDASTLDLPEPAGGIYIQPDLSVIVPGPLSAHDEAELATIALPEQLGVASTLRISEATLSEAFHHGLTGEDIRGVLSRLSLTEIPQPVDYLIATLSERAGSIIVSPHFGDGGRALIEFARPELRATILVDRRLAHLQLQEQEEPGTVRATRPLLSKLRADHVLAALLDARYPARGGGGLATPNDTRTAAAIAAEAEGSDARSAPPHRGSEEALVERVLASVTDSPTDLGRQLTLAIRDKSRLSVTVSVRGAERTFQVVPVSLAAGRLRALDEAAAVERTLPLDAITEITPATPA